MILMPYVAPLVRRPVTINLVAAPPAQLHNTSAYNFAGLALGSARRRDVLVAAAFEGFGAAYSIQGMTIGGTPATQIVQVNPRYNTAIFGARLGPETIAGDIFVQGSAIFSNCAIVVYEKIGGRLTPFHTASSIIGDPTQAALNVPARGGVLAVACSGRTGNGGTVTWTGVNEDVDTSMESIPYSTGHINLAAAENGRIIAADWPFAFGGQSLVCASWAP